MRASRLRTDRETIAQGTKQRTWEVRNRLSEVVPGCSDPTTKGSDAVAVPAGIDAISVDPQGNFLAELGKADDLNANEVVRTLIKLDEAEDAWKRTDRGKFISRLTGADCADAVVAIAHDIRSPLCSILLLVDALRHAEKAAANPIRERQLGLIYGAAFGLSTTVSNS